MKMGMRAWMLLAAAPLAAGLAGCGDFWQAPSSGSYTLSNSGAITVGQGTTGTSTITVTPSSSLSETVELSCAVTAPSGASNATTCSLSSSSLTFSSSSTAQTSTLTATTQSVTTLGDYTITVTGTSGSVTETTSVCVDVTTSTTGNCSSASGTSGVFYVLNQETNQVVAKKIASGSLTTISSLTLPASPLAIAVAPNGNFLYVSTIDGIYLYTINSGGSLTLGNSGGTITQDQAGTMQVDSTNSWLVEVVSGSTQLNAVNINSSTGVLKSTTEEYIALPASADVKQLAISPGSCTSCYVFVALGDAGIETIGFNPGNANPFGNALNYRVPHSGAGDNAIAVDPSNRLLYVGEADALPSATQSGGLRVFTISASGIAELTSAGSPYTSGGTGPVSIVPTSDGNYVYVGNKSVSGSSTDNIASFSVSTTALTPITTATAGPTGVIALAEDSTGGYLMAVDFAGSPDLQIYTMSAGTLSSAFTSTTGTDPVQAVAIAAAP